MVWFGLNIGSDKNADPRWLLPLICRVGEVTKREIGTIRVGEHESRFEIRADEADRFVEAVKASTHKEGRIWRIDADAPPLSKPADASPERAFASERSTHHDARSQHRGRATAGAAPSERAPARFDAGERTGRKPYQASHGAKPTGRKTAGAHQRYGAKGNGGAGSGHGPLKRSRKDSRPS